jgi:hypothetical protein
MSLDPHFACGAQKLRRGECAEAMARARKSIEEVENSRAADQTNTLARLKDDLATAQRNHDAAEQEWSQCGEKVDAERKDRLAKQDSRPVRELRAIVEEERLVREAARVKQDDARLRDALKADRKALVAPIVSALLCATVGARQAVADELAALQPTPAPKKKVKVDKARVAQIQARLQHGDELIDGLKQELAKLSAEPASCTDAKIIALGECLMGRSAGEHPAACADAAVDDFAAVWDFFGVGEEHKDAWASAL